MFLKYSYILSKCLLDAMFTNILRKGEISGIEILLSGVQLQLYNFLLLDFWNIRPGDGCLAKPKHVSIYDYYSKELCIDGLYLYCCIQLLFSNTLVSYGPSYTKSDVSDKWEIGPCVRKLMVALSCVIHHLFPWWL